MQLLFAYPKVSSNYNVILTNTVQNNVTGFGTLFLIFLILVPLDMVFGQDLEVAGKARIITMDQDNTVDKVVVRLPDGTLAVRDLLSFPDTVMNITVYDTVFQVLSISNDTIYLTDGGFVKLPTDQVNDADPDPANEKISSLIIMGDSLAVTEGPMTMKVQMDSSNINELQILSISNDTIFLTNGGFVKLPADQVNDADPDPANEKISSLLIMGDSLAVTEGLMTMKVPVDSSNINELQVLSLSNDTIFLTDGGFVKLPTDQVNDADPDPANEKISSLIIMGDSLAVTEGSMTMKVQMDSSNINELQVLSLSNDTIFLTDGGFVKLPADQVNDADPDPANEKISSLLIMGDSLAVTEGSMTMKVQVDSSNINELQILSISNDTVFLSNGGFAPLPVDLNAGWTMNADTTSTLKYAGIGTTSPTQKLDVDGKARIRMINQDNTLDSVLVADGNGVIRFRDVASFPPDALIKDADMDTRIQVEESPDEDVIRFDLAGTERWVMTGSRLQPQNSGRSLFIGQDAGLNDDLSTNQNVFLGYESGKNNVTGSKNTAIGFQAEVSTGNLSNATAIGANALVSQSNSIVLGNNADVGIGTSIPTQKLDVDGKARIRMIDQDNTLDIVLVADGNGVIQFRDMSTIKMNGTVQGTGSNSLNIRATHEGTPAGNARGENSVDLQTFRDEVTQVASGKFSTVGGGVGNVASGEGATVSGGGYIFISPPDSIFLGNTASGDHSAVGGGRNNTASGIVSTISGGINNLVSAVSSTVGGGNNNEAREIASVVGGGEANTAAGRYSAIPGGQSLSADSYGEVVMGIYNVPSGGNPTTRVDTDPLLIVGNGDFGNNSNALTILKDGKTGVGNISPTELLDVDGKARIRMINQDNTLDSVLVADGNGVIRFRDVASFPPDALIKDADMDTRIQVEESPDEDVIRFDLAGTERWVMTGSRLQPQNSGQSLFIGQDAGLNDDLSANQNVFLGHESGKSNVTGNKNTVAGAYSLHLNDLGSSNVAFGFAALETNSEGDNNSALGTDVLNRNTFGNNNTATGYRAMLSNTTGSDNTGTGFMSLYNNTTGSNNTAIGYESLNANLQGSSNTAIGFQADVSTGNLSNATAIGANAIVSQSNSMVLGNNADVGIGTSTPTQKLDVDGKARIRMINQDNALDKILVVDADGVVHYRDQSSLINDLLEEINLLKSLLQVGTMTDADGNMYPTIQIGSQTWMGKNLNVGAMINNGIPQGNNATTEKYCYQDNSVNCDTYGGLYQWNEAMQYVTTVGAQGICPSGWHIPSDADWTTLSDYLAGASVAGGKMKEAGMTFWDSPNTGASNESRFTALPAGFASGVTSSDLGVNTWWWTSSEASMSHATDRSITATSAEITAPLGSKTDAISIRCLKD